MPEDNPNDPTQAFQNRLKKYGDDALAFATVLFDENHKLRQDKRDLAKQVPADGSVVLSKEEAQKWQAFVDLKLEPKDIEAKLKDGEAVTAERDTLRKRDVLRDVAQAHGYKLSVLEDRDRASGGLEYTLRDDAKTKRKVAYVKHEGKETPLEQFAQEKWADFVPALKAGQATDKAVTSADGGARGDATDGSKLFGVSRMNAAYAENAAS